MKSLKRHLRMFLCALLIMLEGIGLGISGPVPVPGKRKKDPDESACTAASNSREMPDADTTGFEKKQAPG